MTAKKTGKKRVFSWLWSCKRLGFTGTRKTPGIARDLDKTFFVRSWLSTGKKNNSQTQTNPSPTLENEGVTDGTERRVGGEAIAG